MGGNRGWYGFDLDGTLAVYAGWQGPEHIGAPVPKMLVRLKRYMQEGHEVRIFTARVYPFTQIVTPNDDPTQLVCGNDREEQAARAAAAIQQWSLEHIGCVLPITCVKDYGMIRLYDDRCRQVRHNTGELVGDDA